MRIDSDTQQAQTISNTNIQPRQAVAAERQPDGDVDAAARNAAAPAAQQINPEGVGTRIDLMA